MRLSCISGAGSSKTSPNMLKRGKQPRMLTDRWRQEQTERQLYPACFAGCLSAYKYWNMRREKVEAQQWWDGGLDRAAWYEGALVRQKLVRFCNGMNSKYEEDALVSIFTILHIFATMEVIRCCFFLEYAASRKKNNIVFLKKTSRNQFYITKIH